MNGKVSQMLNEYKQFRKNKKPAEGSQDEMLISFVKESLLSINNFFICKDVDKHDCHNRGRIRQYSGSTGSAHL